MLSTFADIFGGSQTQSQSTNTPVNMNPFTGSQGGNVNQLGNTLSGGLPQYGGLTTAPITGNETSTLGTLMGQMGQGGGVAGTNTYLQDVLAGKYMPGSTNGNPFLSQAITAAQQPTMDNLNNTLSRSLPGYFTANGQMISPNAKGQGGSSAFDTAAALTAQTAATTMGNIASQVSNNAYNTGVGQMQGAAQLSQQEITNTVQNLQAQSLPRMIQDMGIQNGLGLFQQNLSGVLQLLSTLGNITRPVVGQNAQSTSTAEQTPGILPDITNLVSAFGSVGKGGGGGGNAS